MDTILKPKSHLKGSFSVLGDKSISHRAVMFGAISNGVTEIEGFLTGDDCLSTIDCFKKLGIEINVNNDKVTIYGKGLYGLKKPLETLYVGNSGTTLRLISGLLSAQPFSCTITGDKSIQKRPMDRIAVPLRQMGADISGIQNKKLFAPLTINGKPLKGINYRLPVASAQVKSAIILASLYADGETIIQEPEPTRDHTEIMLNYLGANIKNIGGKIYSSRVEQLYGKKITVPGDISSAAYFIAAALICPGSNITIKSIGINPTRTGIIDVFQNMGADIKILNKKVSCGELVGDINVKYSDLNGTEIGGNLIPRLIDEIPVIAVVSAFAKGTTVIKDAQELKVKESNRIKTVVTELKKFGVDIQETDDGMIIKGGKQLKGAETESYNDHRVAMSMAVAALMADGETKIINSDCINISFPDFFNYIEKL